MKNNYSPSKRGSLSGLFPSALVFMVAVTTNIFADTPIDNTSSKYDLKVLDLGGQAKILHVTPKMLVIGMATWCPYSKSLKGFLVDQKTKGHLEALHVVIVFSASECKSVNAEFVRELKSQNTSTDSINATMNKILQQEAKSNNMFFDQNFLSDLNFDTYILSADNPAQPDSYPCLYSPDTSEFKNMDFNVFGDYVPLDELNNYISSYNATEK